ncbi:MAG: YfhO family protein [Clostridia bacterium]|nr:YfhO family protein [Clostridia bacterium]
MNNEIQQENTVLQKNNNKTNSFFATLKKLSKKFSSKEGSYLLFSFLIPAIIMYIVYIAMEIHPFGERSVLVLDLNGQYVYFFEAFRNYLRGDASLLYSFSRALGGEFMGIFAYYLASPLSYLVALFPTKRMLEALLVIILLKTGLCGLSFGFYLHKNSKYRNKFIIVAFSVMYALCAYAVVYQNNIMWIDALICLPLITYGIEGIIKFGKYKLFIISLAIGIISNFYIGYMLCIWVAVYFFYYYYATGDGKNNPRGENRHFLRSFIRIGIFSAIAVAISAVVILSAYYSLKFGKNEFSNPNWAFKENFEILDYLTKFLPGSYDTVRPEGLPYVYAGTLMLILVPVYFVAKKISSREKIASLLFILFFSLSFIIRPLDLIWHGFQRPNWLNYRQSFMLVFFLLVLAYKGFGNIRKVGEKFLLGVGAVIVLFTAVVGKLDGFKSYVESNSKLLTLETVWLGILATVAFVALLCLVVKLKSAFKRENVCCAIAALVCIELFCSSLACVVQHHKDVTYSGYDGYNDFLTEMRPIVEKVNEHDSSFYRVEKTKHRKINDNMALGIRGLSNSTSTLNASTIKFLHQMGYSSKSHWSKYLGGNPVSDSLLGIKYIIAPNSSIYLDKYYPIVLRTENAVAYQNDYALSIAYGVDKAVDTFNMEDDVSHFDRLNFLLDVMLGEDAEDIFVPIKVIDETTQNLNEGNSAGHIRYTKVADGDDAYLTFTFNAPTDDEIFIHLPTGYARECIITANSASRGKILGNETERLVSLGMFSPGQSVTIKITLDNQYNDLYVKETDNYFYYLDKSAFETVFTKLSDTPQFVVNEGFTDDNLEGTIKTEKNSQMILTTIPYDEGWKIYLDGEEIEYRETLGALIAFDIDSAGEHTLQMSYRPTPVYLGIVISSVGIVAFIAICVLDFLIAKKRRTNGIEITPAEDVLFELEDLEPEQKEVCIEAYDESSSSLENQNND